MPSRREMLKTTIALPAAAAFGAGRAQGQGPRVAVIGAGAFGGWTALELARRGARVTLIDAWGPGHARASSGGETRVIRATYGTREVYTTMALRALDLWRAHDERFGRRFYRQTGALWLFGKDDSFGKASSAGLRKAGQLFEELTVAAAQRRYPQIAFDGITSALVEPNAGLLLARRACEHVVERVVAEGGEYRQAAVTSPVVASGAALKTVSLADGPALAADVFVFACGPWLGSIFPDVIGRLVTPTRQEVFYFGTPPGDARFSEETFPVWVDFGERLIYGLPGNANRGFKIADDTPGAVFDPTNGSREATPAGLKAMRAFLARRFPALAKAPLIGSEVCQYEASPDSHFIVDRHPGAPNVWLVGGGSGHGFKMGPALGEMVASNVLGTSAPNPVFSVARFKQVTRDQEKWS